MIAWRLAPGVGITPDQEQPGAVRLTAPERPAIVLRPPLPEIADALLSLASGPRGEADLVESAGPTGDALAETVQGLFYRGALRLCVVHEARELLRVNLTSELTAITRVRPRPEQRVQLSRFACLRRLDDELVAESPTEHTRLLVRDPRVGALLTRLAEARRIDELYQGSSLPAEVVLDLVELLTAAGVAGMTDDAGQLAEDVDPVTALREFHDVVLHWHSRRGLNGRPVGQSYPGQGRYRPWPAVPPPEGELIALPRPDSAALRATDAPYAAVAEERHSTRSFDPGELTQAQLGEFLFRTMRVRREYAADESLPYDHTDRPVPSAGATHDLEVYLALTRCRGLQPGFYRYEPVAHGLSLISADRAATLRLVRDACRAMAADSVPQAVVTLAARFNRMAWKYRGLSYAATLKNVGVCYQAMYLAVTAMGLGGCAVGSGDAAAFARITGHDPLEESSVGEFVFGIPLDR